MLVDTDNVGIESALAAMRPTAAVASLTITVDFMAFDQILWADGFAVRPGSTAAASCGSR